MVRLDSNGYAPSIMATEDGLCFLHKGNCETVRHEIYFGIGNRKVSKANGFWVNICPRCHRYIHANKDADEELKRECYKVYTKTHSPEDFFELIGRYYEDRARNTNNRSDTERGENILSDEGFGRSR